MSFGTVVRQIGVPTTTRFGALVLLNVVIWLVAWSVLRHHPLQLGAAGLAYSFGLRHAVDTDHIAAIDNATRKLIRNGRAAESSGTFFALGHSTVVVALSLAIAGFSSGFRNEMDLLSQFGSEVGSLISAVFLLILAFSNLFTFRSLVRTFRGADKTSDQDVIAISERLGPSGLMTRVFRRVFGSISKPWHLYPVGLLFGLGFDTATEIGLLGLSAVDAANHTSVWIILIYPALFTAGMSLVDTANSIFMTRAYGWALRKPKARVVYNLIVTGLSGFIALVVGLVIALDRLRDGAGMHGILGDSIETAQNAVASGGLAIILTFFAIWLVAILGHKVRRRAHPR